MESRFSAFAIAIDLCASPPERILNTEHVRDDEVSFATIQKVLTPGEQDVLRAELTAIVTVMIQAKYGIVHSDCLPAIRLVHLVLHAGSIQDFVGRDHFDLLLQLWTHKESISCQVLKVDSHVRFSEISSPLDKYWAMGNAYVDEVSKSACRSLLPLVVRELREIYEYIQQQKTMLFRACQLQLELPIERAKALASISEDQAATQNTASDLVTAFSNWTVDPCFQIQGEFERDFLHFSMFGRSHMESTLDWIGLLKWPVEGEESTGPLGYNPGVSWIELALSWMCRYFGPTTMGLSAWDMQ